MIIRELDSWGFRAPALDRTAVSPLSKHHVEIVASCAKTQIQVNFGPRTRGIDITRSLGCHNCRAYAAHDCLDVLAAQRSRELMKCSGCSKVWYCSVACQKADWKRHKPHCSAPPRG